MDEFGRPDGSGQKQEPSDTVPTDKEQDQQPPPTSSARLARFHQPDKQLVAPFADMLPRQQQPPEKVGIEEVSGGCCKCTIM